MWGCGALQMSVTGWMRLLHDTLLLDNAITPCIADAVFTGVPLTGDVSTIPKVGLLQATAAAVYQARTASCN